MAGSPERIGRLRSPPRKLEEVAGGAPRMRQPALLDIPGMDLERLRAFAEAATAYARSRPSMRFGAEDLLRVSSPPSPLPWAVVDGAALVLLECSEDVEARVTGAWLHPFCELRFGDEEEVAAQDHEAWRKTDLPLADEDSWPLVTVFEPEEVPRAPDADHIDWITGLLHALAGTREADIAQGTWAREAPTREGRTLYQLELPTLVEVMAELAAEELPEDPEDRARRLLEQARLSVGHSRIHLAREALKAVPDDPEALLILAEECPDPEERIARYEEALVSSEHRESTAAGSPSPGTSKEPLPVSLRARHGLALALAAIGRQEEALEHLEIIAPLDPEDHLEVFESTLALLLSLGRDEEARQLLGRNRDHTSSVFHYAAVLIALRLDAGRPLPAALLKKAVAFNPFVPRLLLADDDSSAVYQEIAALQEQAYDAAQGRVEIYGLPLEDSPEQRDLPRLMDAANEALACVQYLGPAWRDNPEALEWLAAQAQHEES